MALLEDELRNERIADEYEGVWVAFRDGTAVQPPCLGDFLASLAEQDRDLIIRLRELEAVYVGQQPAIPARSAAGVPGDFPEGYEKLGVLGSGGMGVVYRARQVANNRLVALKLIKPPDRPEEEQSEQCARALARFQIEIEAVSRLHHPNIVEIYQGGFHGGRPFFSMELIEGVSLAEKLTAAGPLGPRQAARLLETVARALQHAHERGVLHRDLKPGNIMIDSRDEPHVTDFGLAKLTGSHSAVTQTDVILGSPSYMSPEQAGTNQELTHRTDVYSLGVVLYELLTGQKPFQGNFTELLRQIREKQPVPPSQLRKIPATLEQICLKCLEKEPRHRYASAEALAEDLHRFQVGEPILGRPVPRLERLWLWARRRPAVAAFWGASLVSLAVVVFVLVDRYARQQKAKEDHGEIVVIKLNAELLMRDQKWSEAKTRLVAARSALKAQPDLRDEELDAELERSLEIVERHIRGEAEQQQGRGRFHAARQLYFDAKVYETPSTGLKPADSRERTRDSARQALALYALDREPGPVDPPSAILETDRLYLTPEEHAELADTCYELLLIWAEVEATAPPEQDGDKEQARQRAAERALVSLERADRVRQSCKLKDTETFHRRKARYLAQQRGEKFDPDRVLGGPREPTGALDWSLRATDNYRAGLLEQARSDCEEVLRLQRGHFWARFLHGFCQLQTGHWFEARLDLTACLNLPSTVPQTPVWPLLHRGFASSELGNQYRQATDSRALQLIGSIVWAAPASGTAFPALASVGILGTRSRPGDNEFKDARADFDRVLAMKPEGQVLYVALVNRGALLIRQELWDEAIADLNRAVQLKPKAYPAYLNLSRALQAVGRKDQARAALDQAIEQEPGLALLYEARAIIHVSQPKPDLAAAWADLEQAMDSRPRNAHPGRLVGALVDLGKALYRERQYARALQCYDRALHLEPGQALVERYRAETLLQLGRDAEAGQALDRYLAMNPLPAPEVLLARGLIHARAGQLIPAIETYGARLRLQPDDMGTRSQRGWAYLQTDALRLALADFETCLAHNPQSADFLLGRGLARIRLKQLDGALADAEEAAKRGPLTDRLLYHLAQLYAQAVNQMELESRARRDRLTTQRLGLCAAKAVDFLQRALAALPEERRSSFWHNQVRIDPLLNPIRQERGYLLLARQFLQPGRY